MCGTYFGGVEMQESCNYLEPRTMQLPRRYVEHVGGTSKTNRKSHILGKVLDWNRL